VKVADLARGLDWTGTDLGDRETWPIAVRALVETVFAAPLPMALALGPTFILVYNDAYAGLLGSKHPDAFGCRAAEALNENWSLPGHGEVVERVYRTGEPFSEAETMLPVRRGGPDSPAEVVLFSRAYTPVRSEDGEIAGVLTVVTELTEVAKALSGVADLATRLATALTVDDVVREALRHAMQAGADHARILLPEGTATRMAGRAAADPWDESTERLPPLWVEIPADTVLPSVATLRDGRARWLESREELEPFRAALAQQSLGSRPLSAAAAVPLPVGPWQGALSLGWIAGRAFSPAYRSALTTVGTLIGAALARAQRFDEQFGLADALQRSLLPTGLPYLPRLVLGARYASRAPGSSVGGDFYDAFELPDGQVLIAIGDVVGRGAEAATVMGQVRAALRALALQESDPAVVLSGLDPFVRSLGVEAFVTVLIGLVDEPAGRLTLAGAGHPAPLLRQRSGGVAVVELPPGPPLGRNARRTGVVLPLERGDVLLLYTDGLVSGAASDDSSAEEGLEQIRSLLGERAGLDPRRLCAQLLDRFGGGPDDIALLAISRVDGTRRTSVRSLPAESTSPGTARRWARSVLDSWELGDEAAETAVLCLNELVTNAVLHARSRSRVELDLDRLRLLVLVSDDGQTSTLSAQRTRADAVRGRGLALVEELSDAWGTERDSNGTTVWFELGRRVAAAVT
jgi:anti-sigma regulatory factor (Ser/Thr protein kinase)